MLNNKDSSTSKTTATIISNNLKNKVKKKEHEILFYLY